MNVSAIGSALMGAIWITPDRILMRLILMMK